MTTPERAPRRFAPPTVPGIFRERPNRFLALCEVKGQSVRAHLPNPGRMRELLLPGATVRLAHAASPERKTPYTVVAVERAGRPVFLNTHATNDVVHRLLEDDRIPALRGARVIGREVTLGRSRFDFLLEHNGAPLYLEVKSCTLFHGSVAMFPDAVTARGRRHLLELAALSDAGTRTAVVFVVHAPNVRWFMPDYHTDPAFCEAVLACRDRVELLPISIGWTPTLRLQQRIGFPTMPWEWIERESQDRGAYLLLLTLKRRRTVTVGKLGRLTFDAGVYVYVGSAMQGLTARVARHLRTRKRKHWHIDSLRQVADRVEALPIRTAERIECDLAAAVDALLTAGPAGFGCSDCDCRTHLFYASADPQDTPAFQDLLLDVRLRPPPQAAPPAGGNSRRL